MMAENQQPPDQDYQPEQDQTMDDGFKHKVEVLLRCPVCNQTVTDPRTLNCGHFYCEACIKLLYVTEEDGMMKCSRCEEKTPIPDPDAGLKKHVLGAELVTLLNNFSPTQEAQNDDDEMIPPPAMVNGVHNDTEMDDDDDESIHENGNEIQDIAADPTDTTPDDTENIDEVKENPVAERPSPSGYPIPNQTVADVDVHLDPKREDIPPPEPKEDEQVSQSDSENADPETLPPPHVTEQEKPSSAEPEEVKPAVVEVSTLKLSEKSTEETPETSSEKQNGDVKQHFDETDRGMTEAEVKAAEASLSIECGTCCSKSCTCNVSTSLLTPPVSTGSVHSEEQNDSRAPSEIDATEIQIHMENKWIVKESASNIEMVNKNKIVVTRWTYDDHGIVQAYDTAGNKIKYTNGGHDNYSGIALSNKGNLFVINTNKDRIEEYDIKGKKIKHISVANYSDPHAVDVTDGGEVLVVDRDKNCVRIIGKDRKKKPTVLKDSCMLEPCDIACCNGGFYVCCAETKCILKFDMDGNRRWAYNADPDEKIHNKLKEPQGICVDEKGNLYVVDKGRRTVLVFDSEGQYKGKLNDKLSVGHRKPWYISVRDGNLAILFEHNLVQTYSFA